MRSDAFERLQAQNPLPQLLPNAPIEPILRRIDAERSPRPASISQEVAVAKPVDLTSSDEAKRAPRRPSPDDHVDRQPAAEQNDPGRRRWRPIAFGVLSVLVVTVVVVIAATTIHHGSSVSGPAAGGRIVTLVYRVQPTARAPRVTRAAINRDIAVIRARLVGEPVQATVRRVGADEIRLGLSGAHLSNAQLSAVGQRATATGSLGVSDWEGDALLPDGKSVANELPSHNPRALQISQGDESTPPGGTVGSMTLYQAVTLASKQPVAAGGSRLGPVYYLFGAPGSKLCATAAADRRTRPVTGTHCYLSGPVSDPSLHSPLPAGVRPAAGTWIKVPQGTVVVSGVPNQSGVTPSRFFVLRDEVALTNADVTHVQIGKLAGEDAVEVKLTKQGAVAFQNLTSEIAHRGQQVSDGSHHLFQHIAIGLDNGLLEVAQIDFTRYPDGVIANANNRTIDIVTVSTRQATQLVAILRAGPLPLSLIQISNGG